MRGGISMLNKRYVKANNPLIPHHYNPQLPHNYLLALDANNLYGYVMCQSLPFGNFSWLSETEINEFNILETKADSDVGYIIECDLFYPPQYFDRDNDLALAPEHFTIAYEMLSPYMKNLCDEFGLRSTLPCKKLVPNFFPKSNYITHYMNLKFYVEQGLIVKKIHRILAFSQKPYLKEYITFNNNKRREADNDFEKNFFKKLNNSFYGKSCQNVRKSLNVRGALTEEECKKLLANPLLEEFQIINENFSVFKLKKANLLLNKPIYVGFTVLELSKLRMYELYYKNFKKVYNQNVNLLYMDTDSLYLNIKTHDIYADIKKYLSNILDLSNFPHNHSMFDDNHKGNLGILKSDVGEIPIFSFVGLKPKMYAISYGNEIKKTAKGIKKNALKNVTFETYESILMSGGMMRHQQHSIISKKHEIATVVQNKISLSAYYDKKYVFADGIHSNTYGHSQNVDMCDDDD